LKSLPKITLPSSRTVNNAAGVKLTTEKVFVEDVVPAPLTVKVPFINVLLPVMLPDISRLPENMESLRAIIPFRATN